MEWLIYLSKVSVCLGLFYALYHFFLQKLTFFSLNRFYLLSTLILSFLIPSLQLRLKSDKPELITEKVQSSLPVVVAPQQNFEVLQRRTTAFRSDPVDQRTDWADILGKCYWAIAAVIFFGLLIQVVMLLWHSRKVLRVVGRLKIVQKTARLSNCSFLHYVFVDQQELSPEMLEAVMQHESVHAARYHSIDKMIMGISKALLWFSPPIYFYAGALEQVHEYEADIETSSLIGNTIYASLLLKLAVTNRRAPLVHSFVKNPVKERIKMLFANPSKNMKKLTYLTFVPTGLALVWLFSVQIVYAESKTNFVHPSREQALALPAVPAVMKAAEDNNSVDKKKQLPKTIANPETPVRLVDNVMLGDDPLVIIDGKKYTEDILTRISPACLKMTRFSFKRAEITTRNHKLEYATKSEIETAKTRKRMMAQGKFYNRYRVTINERKYDEVMVKIANVFSEASFPVGYRIALSIDGKILTESEAFKLPGNYAYDKILIEYRYTDDDKELFKKYGDKYDLVMQFTSKTDTSEQKPKVIQGVASNISVDNYGLFEYSAKDSTVFSKDKRYVTLFGNAQIHNEQWTIKAHKIRFDLKMRTATAEKASFTLKSKKDPIEADLVKIDLDKGTYEVLSDIPGL